MGTEDINKTKEIIKDFIFEMNLWEKYCEKIVEENANGLTWDQKMEFMKEKVSEIFVKYCTPKDRKNGRPNILSWGSNGSYIYNPEKEIVIDVQQEKISRIIIYTNIKDENINFCYIFLRKNATWLIDSKKRRWNNEGKWENIFL
jgi:hypothetical protein